jgi:hypothetical protein
VTNVIRRRAIDLARATRATYRAAMTRWLESDTPDEARAYAAALHVHLAAIDALNDRERALLKHENARANTPARLGLN